ncbi:MAG: hypothetical protein LC808_38665 [Actinobacteria bacterium]|nr:hypothetical protein [Actinomycetota bacterium]
MTITVGPTDTPTGAGVGLSKQAQTRTRTFADLVEETGHLKNRTRVLVEDSTQLHQDSARLYDETLEQLLRTATGDRVKESVEKLLSHLSQLGFAWRDVARLVGVSVPALRKWRTGERATGDNHRRVAELVAFCDIVRQQYLIDDVASWLEVPLMPHVPVTGLDLLAVPRSDLLFRWASDLQVDPEELLDDFRPDWRSEYSSSIEVFVASDGQRGLRFKDAT